MVKGGPLFPCWGEAAPLPVPPLVQLKFLVGNNLKPRGPLPQYYLPAMVMGVGGGGWPLPWSLSE